MPWALPLVGLDTLVIVLWAIAAALGISLIMYYVAQAASGIPVIGGPIAGAFKTIARAITQACGKLVSGIEALVGAGLHLLANYLHSLFKQFLSHSILLLHLAEAVGRVAYDASGAHALVRSLERRWHGIEAGVKHLEREVHGIEHGARADIGRLDALIHKDVLPEIRSLDRTIGRVVSKDIAGVRDLAKTAEADVTALQKWISRNALIAGTTALVGAVAWALGQLGLGGLRCPSFGRLLNKWGCGLGGLLDGLLGLVISSLALENVCSLLPILEAAFGEVVGPIIHLLTEVPLGSCEQPPAGWAQLSVAPGPLPPAQTLGSLPV